MAIIPKLQYQPPESWEEFESLTRDLYKNRWSDFNIQKNGRKGQKQNGVDVYGRKNNADKYSGVQNKAKQSYPPTELTISEVKEELIKAETFKPKLADYEIVTTARRDAKLDLEVRKLNQAQRKKSGLEVRIVYWEDVLEMVAQDGEVAKEYFGSQYSSDDIGEQRIEREIDSARALMDDLKIDTACDRLEEIKKNDWIGLSNKLKFKLMNALGGCYLRQHLVEKGADAFLQASGYLPDEENAITNRAWSLIYRKQYGDAIAILEPLIQRNPGNTKAYSNLLGAYPDKSFKELLALIPPHLVADPDISSTLATIAQEKNLLDEAEKYARMSVENAEKPLSIFESKYVLAEIIKDKSKASANIIDLQQIDEKTREELTEASSLLKEAWELIRNTEAAKYNIDEAIRLAHLERLIDGNEFALKRADEIITVSPDDAYTHLLLGLIHSDDNLPLAIQHYEKAAVTGDLNAKILLAEAISDNGDASRAIEILLEMQGDAKDDHHKRYVAQQLISHYVHLKKFEEGKAVAESYLKDFPDDIPVLIQVALSAKAQGDEDAFKAQLQDLIAKLDDDDKNSKVMLADALYKARMYDEAKQIYSTVIDDTANTDWTRRLLDTYYRTGDHKEALRIASNLTKKYGAMPFVTELESHIYESIDKLDEAKKACEEYLKIYPEDVSIQLRLAILNFKMKNYDELDKYLTSFESFDRLKKPGEVFPLADLFAERGMKEKARELLYQFRNNNPNSSDAHVRYVGYFFLKENEAGTFDVDEVANSTEVTISTDFSDIKYLIQDGPSDYSKRQVNVEDPIAKQLLGKKVGDTVSIPEGSEKREVKSIESKYIVALRESQELISDFFPNNGAIQKIHFDENDIEGSIKRLTETTDARRKAVEAVEELYVSNQATIGSFSKHIGTSIIEVFYGLQAGGMNPKIKVFNAPAENIITASKVGEETKLILDVTSLITLTELKLEALLVEQFGNPGVSRATVNEFEEHLRKLEGIGEDGHSTLSSDEDGKLTMENIGQESIKFKIDLTKKILKFIEDNCEVLPIEQALEINADRLAELNDVLGESSTSSILLASEPNRILFTEDNPLRQIAKAEFGVDGIWTQPVLVNLKDAGLIDEAQYHELVIELVKRNHHYTSFDTKTLIKSAELAKWKLDEPLVKMLTVLEDMMLLTAPLLKMVLEFLDELWSNPGISPEDRNEILSHVVALLYKRDDGTESVNQLSRLVDIYFAKSPKKMKEIKTSIEIIINPQSNN